jgi:hypothetical protein
MKKHFRFWFKNNLDTEIFHAFFEILPLKLSDIVETPILVKRTLNYSAYSENTLMCVIVFGENAKLH